MSSILRVEDLKIYYKARKGIFGSVQIKAVDGVSLNVGYGETIAIVGESGSGKTTLGKAILKLLDPTSGRIIFDDQDINLIRTSDVKKFRLQVQGVFQDPYSSMNAFMSVKQILNEPLAIHNIGNKQEREQRILEALTDVNLFPADEIIQKYPHMLSGGQRQRIGLARALILRPKLIIADEPVSMIDASSRAEILYLMRELQSKFNITFLFITHDIATARHFSDKIAVMYAGNIVEYGSPQTIINNPLHPYTQALIKSVPSTNPINRLRMREVIPGEPPSPSNPPTGCKFHPRCPSFISGTCESIEPISVRLDNDHKISCHLWTD